jgi:hypothetical protein
MPVATSASGEYPFPASRFDHIVGIDSLNSSAVRSARSRKQPCLKLRHEERPSIPTTTVLCCSALGATFKTRLPKSWCTSDAFVCREAIDSMPGLDSHSPRSPVKDWIFYSCASSDQGMVSRQSCIPCSCLPVRVWLLAMSDWINDGAQAALSTMRLSIGQGSDPLSASTGQGIV